MPLESKYLCTPQNRSCDIGQYLNFVVFNSGSAGSGREIRFKTLRRNWIPEEEFLHENSKQITVHFLDCKYLRAPMEEILVFMLDCSVKRNSKKFGN